MDEEIRKERNMKYVKIDDKTIICVSRNISDEEARNEYLLKLMQRDQKLKHNTSEKWD